MSKLENKPLEFEAEYRSASRADIFRAIDRNWSCPLINL